MAALEKAKAANAELSGKIIADRVHPGPAGQLLMAGCLLKAWNAPAVVAVVEIDAGSGAVVRVVPLANDPLPRVQKAARELMAALDEKEAGVVKEQRAAAQPVARRYRLVAK